MSTGKDYGMPAEYADWVEMDGCPTNRSARLRVMVDHFEEGSVIALNQRHERWFAPPKPKPTLPDVGFGGVISFISKTGTKFRVMRCDDDWWIDQRDDDWKDGALLKNVDDDGFTVELPGL